MHRQIFKIYGFGVVRRRLRVYLLDSYTRSNAKVQFYQTKFNLLKNKIKGGHVSSRQDGCTGSSSPIWNLVCRRADSESLGWVNSAPNLPLKHDGDQRMD